jgi:hypothetical protein
MAKKPKKNKSRSSLQALKVKANKRPAKKSKPKKRTNAAKPKPAKKKPVKKYRGAVAKRGPVMYTTRNAPKKKPAKKKSRNVVHKINAPLVTATTDWMPVDAVKFEKNADGTVTALVKKRR